MRLRALLLAALLALGASAPARAAAEWEKFFTLTLGDYRAELAEAKAKGRKAVLVFYHFDECPACARMKAAVLSRPEVQEYFAPRFVAFPLDVRGSLEIVDFAGGKTTERAYARQAKVRGTPTIDFFSLDGKLIARVPGAIDDPRTFLALGEWISSGAHARQTFDQYRLARGLDAGPLKLNVVTP